MHQQLWWLTGCATIRKKDPILQEIRPEERVGYVERYRTLIGCEIHDRYLFCPLLAHTVDNKASSSMSFREMGGRPTRQAVDRVQSLPKIRVADVASPPSNRRPRPMALHGRLVRSEMELRTKHSEETTATASSVESIRDQLNRCVE